MNTLLHIIFSYTPLRFYVQSFWRDEAFSYLMAKQDIAQMLIATAKDANPPFYYFFLHFWMLLFGNSEVAIRTVSFIFFLASLYIVGIILMEFFKTSIKQTLFFLMLFVLNPLLCYYAFEGRMYSMFSFFSLLSFYFLYKKSYRGYLVASILGLYTHYFMLFVLAAQVVYVFAVNKHLPKKIVGIFIKIAALFFPWLLVVIQSHPPISKEFWIPHPNLSTLLNLPGLLFTGYEDLIGFRYPFLLAISFFFIVFSLYILYNLFGKKRNRTYKQNDSLGIFLLAWVLVPLTLTLAISFFKPIFLPRYTIFITMGFLFLFIYTVRKLERRLGLFFVIGAMLLSVHYGVYQTTMRTKANLRLTLQEIKAIMGKNDVVYVIDPYNFHPAQYYINDKSVFIFGKTYEELPWFIGKVLIPEDKIATSLPAYPRKAFILNSDTSYTVQALY